MKKQDPIGVFDSGLGGISVLKTLHEMMPHETIIYLGDSKYNPYGTRSKEEITERCIAICDQFIEQGVKAIVIACNTATSACVPLLRKRYDVDIIGMEPALKVACSLGKHQNIAVWATELTLKEKKFVSLMERFQDEHTIHRVACPKLVQLVENDQLDNSDLVDSVLQEYISQVDIHSLDSIVLGCTHFVFFKERLQALCPHIQIVDGNLGTVLHLQDLLSQKDILNPDGDGSIIWTNTLEEKIEQSKRLFVWGKEEK